MFVPLAHPAGEAQADFGEALVVNAGVEQKAHYLAMDLPHSDDCFVAAFPAETTEAFLEGHERAFAYFGGVPTRIRPSVSSNLCGGPLVSARSGPRFSEGVAAEEEV
jgi:transposase